MRRLIEHKLLSRFWVMGVLMMLFFLAVYLTTPTVERILSGSEGYSGQYEYIKDRISESFLTIFAISFVASLFFIYFPPEISLAFFVHTDTSLIKIGLSIFIGVISAQVVNYYVGQVLGRKVLRRFASSLSKRFVTGSRTRTARIVFLFNTFPLPSDILTLLLGAMKVDLRFSLTYIVLGQLTKYTILVSLLLIWKHLLG